MQGYAAQAIGKDPHLGIEIGNGLNAMELRSSVAAPSWPKGEDPQRTSRFVGAISVLRSISEAEIQGTGGTAGEDCNSPSLRRNKTGRGHWLIESYPTRELAVVYVFTKQCKNGVGSGSDPYLCLSCPDTCIPYFPVELGPGNMFFSPVYKIVVWCSPHPASYSE